MSKMLRKKFSPLSQLLTFMLLCMTTRKRQILKISPLAIFYRFPPLVVQNTCTASHQLAILCGAACILKHIPVSLYTTTKPWCFSTPSPSKPCCLQTGPVCKHLAVALINANKRKQTQTNTCLQTVICLQTVNKHPTLGVTVVF